VPVQAEFEHGFRQTVELETGAAGPDRRIGEVGIDRHVIAQRRRTEDFHAAGGIAAQTASLSDYAATFYQNVSTRSNTILSNQTTQDDRLNEANSRVAANSGVNLDEELTSLSSYQQAYAASARMLTVLDQLYKTLLDIQ